MGTMRVKKGEAMILTPGGQGKYYEYSISDT